MCLGRTPDAGGPGDGAVAGVEGGDNGGSSVFRLRVFRLPVDCFLVFCFTGCGLDFPVCLVAGPLLHEDLFEAFFLGGGVELGDGREDAKTFVLRDLFDGFGCGREGAGEVSGGDLEAVEEEPGAAGLDVAGGDAEEDLADGCLDGAAVLGEGQGEGAGAGEPGAGRGFAGGVVVVAEVFEAERLAAAAMSVGEDVTALVDGTGVRNDFRHWEAPHGPGFEVEVKCEAPGECLRGLICF